MPGHHDALFRLAFTQPSDAAALLRELVPPSLARAIDWSSLRLASGSFVDESLRSRYSDLLFEVRVGDMRALLYLLCEHQSRSSPRMPLRFSRYMDRIWAREDERTPAEDERLRETYLPPVIPILISNAPGGWTAPTRFHELFDPALFDAVVRYIDAVGGGNRVIFDEFCANLELTAPNVKENVMTHLEKLISQGEARGRQEGRQELLGKLLVRKFGELPSAIEARLAGASASALDAWAERVLFADTLEQVFADEH